MVLVKDSIRTKYTSSLRPPPYGGVVIGHSSYVMQMGLARLLESSQCGLDVYACAGSTAGVVAALTEHDDAIALIDNDLDGGGAVGVIAQCLRSGQRPPVVSLIDATLGAPVPWGFSQAIVDAAGDGRQIASALVVASQGGTYVDPALRSLVAASADTSPESNLTPREVQMLCEIAHGLGSKQIAFNEDISIETVKTHVTNAMHKLHVGTRAHAIAEAYEQGIIGNDISIVTRSTIVGLRHAETMIYATYSEAAEAILQYLQRTLGFDAWIIAQAIADQWVALQSVGMQTPTSMRWVDTLCARMINGGGPHFSGDIAFDQIYQDLPAAHLGIHAYLGIPLFDDDEETVATLCAVAMLPRNTIDAADMARAEDCAELLAQLVPAGLTTISE